MIFMYMFFLYILTFDLIQDFWFLFTTISISNSQQLQLYDNKNEENIKQLYIMFSEPFGWLHLVNMTK